jgi:c-di-GMP-binding flagellar brake protein YcgR
MFIDLSIIKPGQKIFLCREGDITRHVSYVREIINRAIFVDLPEKKEGGPGSGKLFLSAGTSVRVQLPVLGSLYQFMGSVLQSGSHPDLTGISVPGRVERVEMRRFIRAKKMLRVQYAVLPDGEEPVYKYAESVNISAGGMHLTVSEYIKQGEQLVLNFIISQDNKYSSLKEITRVTRVIPAGEKDMFHIGVEFLNMKKNKFDFISKYVMKTIWAEAVL